MMGGQKPLVKIQRAELVKFKRAPTFEPISAIPNYYLHHLNIVSTLCDSERHGRGYTRRVFSEAATH